MLRQLNLRVQPHVAADEQKLIRTAASELAIDARTVCGLRIRRRSIDARQRQIYINLSLDRASITNPSTTPT